MTVWTPVSSSSTIWTPNSAGQTTWTPVAQNSSNWQLGGPCIVWDKGTALNCKVVDTQGLTVINTVSSPLTPPFVVDIGIQGPLSAAQKSGKYYYEITCVELGNSFSGGFCLAQPGTSYDQLGVVDANGNNINCTLGVLASGGDMYLLGLTEAGFVPWTQGDTVGIAVDLDNGKVWFKVVNGPSINVNGRIGADWNGGALAGDRSPGDMTGSNPVTNTLGIPLPPGALIPYMIFGSDQNILDTFEANFGQNRFAMYDNSYGQGGRYMQNFASSPSSLFQFWPTP